MANFVKVAETSEIPAGQGKCIEINGQRIAIFNVDGTFYAIDDVCQHQGGPLGEGELEGKVVTCPWHGWEYDVTTGVSTLDDDLKQDQFEVQINGDDILVGV
jgi:nitrite reductase/ring-hydroxylating ferredoxin subunit